MSHIPLFRLNEDERSGLRNLRALLANNANAGLVWDKFFDQWKSDFCGLADAVGEAELGGKANWVSTFAGLTMGDPGLLQEHQSRRADFLAKTNGFAVNITFDSRFVTGLGLEHPIENGFAWHHLLGVPYLPGSGVKGLLRAWARQVEADDINDVFGGPADTETGVGRLIVLDALPTIPVRLAADVITPHIGSWLASTTPQNDPPGDWIDPVPIPFLTVERGTSLECALLPRCQNQPIDPKQIQDWLTQALAWFGAGAKTATGYGRAMPDQFWAGLPSVKISSMAAPSASPTQESIGVAGIGVAGFKIGDDVIGVTDDSVVGRVIGFVQDRIEVDFDGDIDIVGPDDIRAL